MDRKWMLEVTASIAGLQSSQNALCSKLDEHIKKTDEHLAKLDRLICGNGHKGIAEEVRSIKGIFGVVYSLIMLSLEGLMIYGSRFIH